MLNRKMQVILGVMFLLSSILIAVSIMSSADTDEGEDFVILSVEGVAVSAAFVLFFSGVISQFIMLCGGRPKILTGITIFFGVIFIIFLFILAGSDPDFAGMSHNGRVQYARDNYGTTSWWVNINIILNIGLWWLVSWANAYTKKEG